LLVVTHALGQTSAEVMTAREIANRGREAYDAGDFETAAGRLQEAYQPCGVQRGCSSKIVE